MLLVGLTVCSVCVAQQETATVCSARAMGKPTLVERTMSGARALQSAPPVRHQSNRRLIYSASKTEAAAAVVVPAGSATVGRYHHSTSIHCWRLSPNRLLAPASQARPTTASGTTGNCSVAFSPTRYRHRSQCTTTTTTVVVAVAFPLYQTTSHKGANLKFVPRDKQTAKLTANGHFTLRLSMASFALTHSLLTLS